MSVACCRCPPSGSLRRTTAYASVALGSGASSCSLLVAALSEVDGRRRSLWNGRRAAPRAEVEWRYADRHAPAEGDPAGHPERQADGHHGGAGSEPRPGEPRGAAEGRGLRLPPLLPAPPPAVPTPRG